VQRRTGELKTGSGGRRGSAKRQCNSVGLPVPSPRSCLILYLKVYVLKFGMDGNLMDLLDEDEEEDFVVAAIVDAVDDDNGK